MSGCFRWYLPNKLGASGSAAEAQRQAVAHLG